MIPRGARPLPAHQSARVSDAGRQNGRVVQLHRPRRGGQASRERLVMRERAMAPHDLLRRLPRKVGLRIGWGDEGRVGRVGRERALGHAVFGAAEDGTEDGEEEVAAFLREDVPEGGVLDSGRDGLQCACFFPENQKSEGGGGNYSRGSRTMGTRPRTSPASMPPRRFISMTHTAVSRSPFRMARWIGAGPR